MRFQAPGKLLLSGEYAVLDGAQAISCPSHKGQFLEVQEKAKSSTLEWHALTEDDHCWLQLSLSSEGEILQSNDSAKAELIRDLLLDAFDGEIPVGLRVETKLNFKREWGLGSSSTLIALVAKWAQKDAMDLFFKHLKGSGYDVATALEKKPISYQIIADKKANWAQVSLPKVLEKSYFLYLGEKQISSTEVVRYVNLERKPDLIKSISQLSAALLSISSEKELIDWMAKHEQITGQLIQQEGHREKRFPQLKGGFKSLGAWGGDFVWIMSLSGDLEYLNELGYHEVFPFHQILNV